MTESNSTWNVDRRERLIRGYYVSTTLTILSAAACLGFSWRDFANRQGAQARLDSSSAARLSVSEFQSDCLHLLTTPSGSDLNLALEQARVSGNAAVSSSQHFSDLVRREVNPTPNSTLDQKLVALQKSSAKALGDIEAFQSSSDPKEALRDLADHSDQFHRDLDDLTRAKSQLNITTYVENSRWLFLTCLLVLLGSVAKNLFVVRPLYQSVLNRQRDLEQSKDEVESTLKQIIQQSSTLQQQQAVLEEQVNDNKVMAENFQLATHRLQTVLGTLPIACIGVDVSGRVYEWNEAAHSTFGYAQFDVFEMKLSDAIIGDEDREFFAERLQEAAELDQPVSFELPTVGKDGQRAMIEWNAMPMRGMNGEVASIQLTANDITERVAQAAKLKDLAFKDALTGLCNRRSFLETVHSLYPSTSLTNPTSVILMDVDKFKNYNDTYGHQGGDELLRRVGELMIELVSEPHLPARYGGEEFVVLLPGTGSEEAYALAEVLRVAIETRTTDLHGATSSFGVSTSTDPTREYSELIEEADKALYYSKHMGRNRTTIWHDSLAAEHAA